MDDDATLESTTWRSTPPSPADPRTDAPSLRARGTRDNEFQVAQKIREIRTAANCSGGRSCCPRPSRAARPSWSRSRRSANAGRRERRGLRTGLHERAAQFRGPPEPEIDRADGASLSASADLGIPLLCGAIIKMPVSEQVALLEGRAVSKGAEGRAGLCASSCS